MSERGKAFLAVEHSETQQETWKLFKGLNETTQAKFLMERLYDLP